jgi:HlyD family secretion protein
VPFALQVREAAAGLEELAATVVSRTGEIRSLAADLRGLEQEADRAEALAKTGAATAQQLDKLEAARDAARHRLESARAALGSLEGRRKSLQSRLEFLDNQRDRCRILSPASGTVLTRYRSPGEAVAPGQSVFEIGRSDSVRADFFVPRETVAGLSLGDTVRIRVEGGGGEKEEGKEKGKEKAARVPAVIRFIAEEAEFTPKNIQTRESRAELIFRVRAQAAAGDGLLKRGMPVEIWR